MDSLLVPGRCFFYVSAGESAPPFRPREGAQGIAPSGWLSVGNTSRESVFELAQVKPDEEEQMIFEEFPTLCHTPKYWKFALPLIDFNRLAWGLAAPGGVDVSDVGGYAVGDFEPVVRSVVAVFVDGPRVSGVYFRRVKLFAEGGFSLSPDVETAVVLSGFVVKPDVPTWGKFLVLDGEVL